jgi:hypothetical protein
VAVQALPRSRQQDRTGQALAGGQVNGPTDPGRQGDERQLGSLAQDGDGTVAALGAQVLDVDATRLRDPEAQQPEQTGQGVIDRPSGGGLGRKAPSSMRSRPRVVDSVSILGRRTCSAGDSVKKPSMTAKR